MIFSLTRLHRISKFSQGLILTSCDKSLKCVIEPKCTWVTLMTMRLEARLLFYKLSSGVKGWNAYFHCWHHWHHWELHYDDHYPVALPKHSVVFNEAQCVKFFRQFVGFSFTKQPLHILHVQKFLDNLWVLQIVVVTCPILRIGQFPCAHCNNMSKSRI